ncbi:hypothetical protein FSHL1_009919 [Fusarium sambucinum]
MRPHIVLQQTSLVGHLLGPRKGSLVRCRSVLGAQSLFKITSAKSFSTERSNTIGFIGLGAMGNHMLNNLISRYTKSDGEKEIGFALCDVNQAAVDNIMKRHGSEHPNVPLVSCSSPYDVAQKASTIISMVPTGKHVQEVYIGEGNSVLSALNISKTVALQLRQVGADLVDAPVSGGVIGAKKGTLAIMVGGSKASFDRSIPVLSFMASKVTYCRILGLGLLRRSQVSTTTAL